MIELELLGIGADSETLVFSDANGERYCVPITDELRSSVRRDRPKIEAVPTTSRNLRPREIQSLLRAGITADEIASEHGMDVLYIRRFEAPVEAEKNYALNRALNFRIGGTADGPLMGELVVDRLAARGVSPRSLTWTARRDVDGPWEIVVTFIQGATEHSASWHVDTSTAHLEAIDQEARWLTETVASAPTQAIFSSVTPVSDIAAESAEEMCQREALVDQLNAARGRRVEIEVDDDIDAEEIAALFGEDSEDQPAPPPSISARIYSIAQSRTKTSIPVITDTATSLSESTVEVSTDVENAPSTLSAAPVDNVAAASPVVKMEDSPNEAPSAGTLRSDAQDSLLPGLEGVEAHPTTKKRRKRRSVPSWDEIVFGSKPQ